MIITCPPPRRGSFRMVPKWVDQYIGIEFSEKGMTRDGLNCWGLVRLILREQFHVRGLPDYAEHYAGTRDTDALARLFSDESEKDWVRIGGPGDLRGVGIGDVPLYRVGRMPSHVGLIVAPATMIHIEQGIDSVLTPFSGLEWGRRLLGVFRHRSMDLSEFKGL